MEQPPKFSQETCTCRQTIPRIWANSGLWISKSWQLLNSERVISSNRDTLFVEIGDGKRHPRALPSELKELLLPKRDAAPVKDQVAHFYEAQLIHYGLTRSKDKNTAEVRLTAALRTDGLKVSSEVQKRETEMKKEYAAATRKLKAAEKKSTPSAVASPKGKKREADDGASTTIE